MGIYSYKYTSDTTPVNETSDFFLKNSIDMYAGTGQGKNSLTDSICHRLKNTKDDKKRNKIIDDTVKTYDELIDYAERMKQSAPDDIADMSTREIIAKSLVNSLTAMNNDSMTIKDKKEWDRIIHKLKQNKRRIESYRKIIKEAAITETSKDSKLTKYVKNNLKAVDVEARSLADKAVKNFKNNTTHNKKFTMQQVESYADSRYYSNAERTVERIKDNKRKIKYIDDILETYRIVIEGAKEQKSFAPDEVSTKKAFAATAINAASSGIIKSRGDYDKDKWGQILEGLEDNQEKFKKLKASIKKEINESNTLI